MGLAFQNHKADPGKLLELFDVRATPSMRTLAQNVMSKEAKVYYFNPVSGRTQDISDLDPGARDAVESGWGGLTEFSGRVADLVAGMVSAAAE